MSITCTLVPTGLGGGGDKDRVPITCTLVPTGLGGGGDKDWVPITCTLIPTGLGGGGDKDRVRLEEVRAITLEPGKWTNARRVSAIPQVQQTMGLVVRRPRASPQAVCEVFVSKGLTYSTVL